MKEKLLSAYISADEGVVAITDKAVYVYTQELNEVDQQKLLKKLATATEINTEHWTLVWKKESTGE